MSPKKTRRLARPYAVLTLLMIPPAFAHDPVFGVGPHVLYKEGIEIHLGTHQKKSSLREMETEFVFKYGITGDWVAGIGIGYSRTESSLDTVSGRVPPSISTKYRFWRNDQFAEQESAAIFGRVIFEDGDNGYHSDATNDNDYLLGVTYGYEGRQWYRWASVRHRWNADTVAGVERPSIWLVDLVGGLRFSPTEYLEPDWVWMLELNGEITGKLTQFSGDKPLRVGGNQWFISPGLMWTYRNVAIKAGVQLPLWDDLQVDQEADDYRVLVELEWHL